MEILYVRGKGAFLVRYDNRVYFVSLTKNRVIGIDDIEAQELLQGGYWEVYEGPKDDQEVKKAIIEYISLRKLSHEHDK